MLDNLRRYLHINRPMNVFAAGAGRSESPATGTSGHSPLTRTPSSRASSLKNSPGPGGTRSPFPDALDEAFVARAMSQGICVGAPAPMPPRLPPLVIQAAAQGDAAAVRRLGPDAVNARSPLPYCPESLGVTPLLAGVLQGDMAVVAAAVFSGHAIDARHDVIGWTGLMYAVSRNDPAMVNFLLQAGADPRTEGFDGLSALTLAEDAAEESMEGRAMLRAIHAALRAC